MRISVIALGLILTSVLSASFAQATTGSLTKGWPAVSDPALMDRNYEYRFSALPLKGFLPQDQIPWSETYWPRNKGSINIRWNAPGMPGFDYSSPSKMQVMQMTRAQLAQLSPSEKYDLAMGRYDYPLTQEVYQTRAKRDAKDWEGLCDGWTASALQLKEPKPVEIMNPDGILIPFGSSDVKGLLAYYVSQHQDLGNIQVGAYCGHSTFCPELNAGAYHVILANQIGLKHEGFAADVESGHEIWNQPVYGYEFQVLGSARSLFSNSSRALRIHAILHYTSELDRSLWNPVLGTPQFQSDILVSDYVLEMDSEGNITGGYWLSKRSHPDNFWKPTRAIEFSGYFERLNSIYQPNQ